MRPCFHLIDACLPDEIAELRGGPHDGSWLRLYVDWLPRFVDFDGHRYEYHRIVHEETETLMEWDETFYDYMGMTECPPSQGN